MENGLHQTCRGACFNAELSRYQTRRYGVRCAPLHSRDSYPFTENMRKMFTKWLGAARTARRRRVTLQQCEEEMKHARLLIVWDKWRERYQDIQLQPLVGGFSNGFGFHLMDILQAESFALQKQTNLVFYAFGIWHSKTRVSRGLWNGRQSSGVLMNTHATSSRFPPSASMFLT